MAQQIRSGFPFVVLHAGNLGFYGAWETLAQAARLLENDGVGFVFVGEGAQREKLETAAAGCASLRLLPFRPPEEIPYVLAAGDLHVVTLRRGLEGVVVPSKMYPILAAGRPILAVAPETADVARIVRRTGCGLVADPDDPQSVARAIREVRHQPERLLQMAQRAREIAEEYDRVKQLCLFTQVVEEAGGW